MTELVLHHFPGACSQVCVFALEEAGLAYSLRLVDLSKNAQSEPDYLALSPMGKVPMILIEGVPLTENAAILTYIAESAPHAGLFPASPSPRMRGEMVGGMSFCGGTLHPSVRGFANPTRMTTGDGEPVREKSLMLLKKGFGYAESRMAQNGWWLGEWSVIDVYLSWAFSVARRYGFDVASCPTLASLPDRLSDERPAFRRMIEGEAKHKATLGLPA